VTTRIEHDLLGDLPVPADAYYGVHTVRARENFRVTGESISRYPELIAALAAVKQAAALANMDLGVLDDIRGRAIVDACKEIRSGALLDQFVLDPIQGGAGTSTNMNANEVIANRALEILGRNFGDYDFLSPLEHVNRGQSTNDEPQPGQFPGSSPQRGTSDNSDCRAAATSIGTSSDAFDRGISNRPRIRSHQRPSGNFDLSSSAREAMARRWSRVNLLACWSRTARLPNSPTPNS
jgi:hypothetical protein